MIYSNNHNFLMYKKFRVLFAIVGIKYQLLNNIVMYDGHRCFIGYMKSKNNINFLID
ncbi:hypothetical protein ECHHL_0532 [Ehrlichia chaffeensis str. Heartland]|nr:hypothetical protein ECHHL_0532 [Ehrlichia chaffeensis str. Heartland]AHX05590.1 hypothetical protein ECHJAX_0525 [Ehrlichia chaffeensis str. Jax]AHX06580.1 hypothetical protein ECHLIB_0526 [Ehrlichia chaffeensis str. Liberty]AHX07659.1 hypothetical protein ECHOSC_0540 [Ehrlichia chaffeensis str. Osceola]AHX08398.1 hypothetical protein ECHSTV_0514 [Ehrlichia chaffeensis str. Saint Vincent]AHX09753.1 hypothetical protein ECHWAK_0520 [Ehrlichia chaffeensis str. Wakulla]AHX10749.1 hypothetica